IAARRPTAGRPRRHGHPRPDWWGCVRPHHPLLIHHSRPGPARAPLPRGTGRTPTTNRFGLLGRTALTDTTATTATRLDITQVRQWLHLLHHTSPGLTHICATGDWTGRAFT